MRTSHLLSRLEHSLQVMASLRSHIDAIAAAAERVHQTLHRGDKVLTAGNGGSAAHALHLAEELIGRYRSDRRAFAAVCLNADPTALTCIANDFGFDEVFARQCQALLRPGDLLVAFSTSGQSPNVIKALEVARSVGAGTIGILGKDGGKCRALCDLPLVVNSDDSAAIQEAHQVIIHLLCERMESDS